MLFDDDVVADREAKPGPSPVGLVVKKGLNIFHRRRNSSAVVADPDFHTIAKVFGGRSQGRLVVASIGFRFAWSLRRSRSR